MRKKSRNKVFRQPLLKSLFLKITPLYNLLKGNPQKDNFHKFISNIDKQYPCDILAMIIHQGRILGVDEGYRLGDEKNREIRYIYKHRS